MTMVSQPITGVQYRYPILVNICARAPSLPLLGDNKLLGALFLPFPGPAGGYSLFRQAAEVPRTGSRGPCSSPGHS